MIIVADRADHANTQALASDLYAALKAQDSIQREHYDILSMARRLEYDVNSNRRIWMAALPLIACVQELKVLIKTPAMRKFGQRAAEIWTWRP